MTRPNETFSFVKKKGKHPFTEIILGFCPMDANLSNGFP